jgi:hypothetical protein
MGNPSDGFHGKTISLSIKNFWADVTIHESQRLVRSTTLSALTGSDFSYRFSEVNLAPDFMNLNAFLANVRNSQF